jgi:hypothetical protein
VKNQKSNDERKTLVGNLIYPCILFAHGKENVGKITGMLIEDKN